MEGVALLDDLKRELTKYHRKYRHPDLADLTPSDLYALFPEDAEPLATMRWDQQWPNSDHGGVYLIFNKTGKLLYVGKAWIIGHRLSSYFRYPQPRGEGNRCEIVHRWTDNPTDRPMYIATVAVPDESKFEAAALEEYLIRELKPLVNERRLPLMDAVNLEARN